MNTTAMDAGYVTSDAELDSECESDPESELTAWLVHLNQCGADAKEEDHPRSPPRGVTPRQVMDSFRSSVLEARDGSRDLDLDALLGDLCSLESQLSAQRDQLDTALDRHNDPADTSQRHNDPAGLDRHNDPHTDTTQNATQPASLHRAASGGGSTWDAAIDADLAAALAVLSDLTSSAEESSDRADSYCGINNNVVKSPSAVTPADPAVTTADPAVTPADPPPPPLSDADSAFSDNVSSSSGSHVSVTAATTGDPRGDPAPAAAQQGNAEAQAKLKAEKVRIALEKIKEANIRKLFVRVHAAADGSSKSLLADETMTVAAVTDALIAKNHVQPGAAWCVVEELPDLHMERLLEDHESLVCSSVLLWPRQNNNRLVFCQRPDRFSLLTQPQEDCGGGSDWPVPPLEGFLHMKSDGKKAWKKLYFVLRASGLYYRPHSKTGGSQDLVCAARLADRSTDRSTDRSSDPGADLAVYIALDSWKKKYKAPTNFGFAVKPAALHKKSPKYIRYLCAEDEATRSRWTTGLRIARFGGRQLRENAVAADERAATWWQRDVVPNPHFEELLVRQHTLAHQYSGRQSYAGAELGRHLSLRASFRGDQRRQGGSTALSDSGVSLAAEEYRADSPTQHSPRDSQTDSNRDSPRHSQLASPRDSQTASNRDSPRHSQLASPRDSQTDSHRDSPRHSQLASPAASQHSSPSHTSTLRYRDSKRAPNLPVNTETTRYLSQMAGTLGRVNRSPHDAALPRRRGSYDDIIDASDQRSQARHHRRGSCDDVLDITSRFSHEQETEGRYSTLTSKCSTLRSGYSTLGSDYSTLPSDYSTMSTDYSTMSTDYSTMSTDYSTVSTDSSYSTLSGRYHGDNVVQSDTPILQPPESAVYPDFEDFPPPPSAESLMNLTGCIEPDTELASQPDTQPGSQPDMEADSQPDMEAGSNVNTQSDSPTCSLTSSQAPCAPRTLPKPSPTRPGTQTASQSANQSANQSLRQLCLPAAVPTSSPKRAPPPPPKPGVSGSPAGRNRAVAPAPPRRAAATALSHTAAAEQDSADLPPPPAELLEGLHPATTGSSWLPASTPDTPTHRGKKPPPPPPPKRGC